jgi:hypothetical protein
VTNTDRLLVILTKPPRFPYFAPMCRYLLFPLLIVLMIGHKTVAQEGQKPLDKLSSHLAQFMAATLRTDSVDVSVSVTKDAKQATFVRVLSQPLPRYFDHSPAGVAGVEAGR